ncbi:hypothetical protein QBC46DRAFT_338119 [Diplogelasinospora grovesii]|uniref:Protein kinase domain-containing protein n=1 Tax=Diplogelasinospora grovesii TaxID=303347 RepID=A0AAN6NDI3_9PEZI|nr:hypothetical protein QBC46DRAFT_338119 [Diplogelasinospora grovesii]
MGVSSKGHGQEHGQDDRHRAINSLETWAEDYESILRSIPLSERAAPSTSSACKPGTYKGVDRSPYLLRRKKNQVLDPGCCKAILAGRGWSPEHSDDDGGRTQMPGTPTPAQTRRGGQRGLARRPHGDRGAGATSSHSGRVSNRQYCTQKCLLGLVAGGLLDEKCPNFARTLDDGIVRLGKQGARGVLFQITLLAYGYTFVSKATTARFRQELEHETNVYRRLRSLQGTCVPVFLGAADLRDVGRTYFYDFQVHITYLLFLSWGGVSLDEAGIWEAKGKVTRLVVRSVRALHIHGVAHTDVRDANALWNRQTERAVVIDFEQAVLAEAPRPALSPVVPNKRRRCVKGMRINKPQGQLSSKIGPIPFSAVQDDILAAKMILQ